MLEIKNIEKKIQNRMILKSCSMRLKKGQAVALLGPNGSGKTTCFSIVTGIIFPDHGKILLNNEDITQLPIFKRARMGIGYLPQDSSVFREMSVSENILSVLELVYSNQEEQEKKLTQLLDDFELSHLRSAQASILSGGEKRRLEIARALARSPEYILLDEPFAGIDPISIGDIRIIISKLKNKNIGVLITDHNVRETLKIVDYAYILNDGKIICEGTSHNVIQNDIVKKTYLGNEFVL